MKERANILVLGTSGAGKSTLINTVIGREEAKVSSGKHGTEKMEPYVSEDLNFQLIDSRGFEYSYWGTKKAVKDMRSWLKEGLKDKKPRIHMLWFCIDAISKRMTRQTIKTMEEVKKEWENVPIIVVLTKSFFAAEDAENIAMVKERLSKAAKKTGTPVAIIPVLAQPPKEETIVSRGIEELIQVTEDHLDEAVKSSEEAVKKYDLKCKRIKAHTLTIGAATSGGIVGAVPISFPDAAILVPLETSLITGIASIYKIDKESEVSKKIISRIIEAGGANLLAKAIINKLKLIPGIMNLAADALNAIVAGTIVFGIGEASIVIMEKIYQGGIDKENLDWINDIIENKMGKVLNKVVEKIKEQQGKIDLKDILSAIVKGR